MAKRLAGVTVLEGGKVKWATVAGIFLGVPAVTITHGVARTIQMVYAALDWLILGPLSFAEQVLNVAFIDAVYGIGQATASFAMSAPGAGALAPVFAAVGTAFVAYVFYRGVTAIGA
jgi:hypothetical protein